jgi:hypothetical protein
MADRGSFTYLQTGFSAGELSPRIYGRTDLDAYARGAAHLRNVYVDVRGGVSTRPGTQFISFTGNPLYKSRLVPFMFSSLQTYMLEFGHYYMRVYQRGAQVLNDDGTVFEIATPWPASDVWRLRHAQSADTMWLVHPSHQPRKLTRTAANNWTLTAISYGTSVPAPAGVAVSAKVGGGSTTYRYVVTATVGSEESLPSDAAGAVSAAVMSVNGNEFMTVTWEPVAKATIYSIYRQMEVPSDAPDLGALYGLVGTTQGLAYQDRNGQPDFSQCPPQVQNPFQGGAIQSIAISAGGASYSSATYVVVTDPTGQGFRGFPTISGGVITGVVVQQGGWGYTAPVVSFVDPGGGGTGAAGDGTVEPEFGSPGAGDAWAGAEGGANGGGSEGGGE